MVEDDFNDLVKKVCEIDSIELEEKAKRQLRFFKNLKAYSATLELEKLLLGTPEDPISLFEDSIMTNLYALHLLCAEMKRRKNVWGEIFYQTAVENLFDYRISQSESLIKESISA